MNSVNEISYNKITCPHCYYETPLHILVNIEYVKECQCGTPFRVIAEPATKCTTSMVIY